MYDLILDGSPIKTFHGANRARQWATDIGLKACQGTKHVLRRPDENTIIVYDWVRGKTFHTIEVKPVA